MNRHFSGRPSPALVVSVFALVIALGGTAYAAGVLPKDSVGTEQLKTQAVTKPKLAKNAVTSLKVKPDTLRGVDIKESTLGQVPKADIANSASTAKNADTAKTAADATTLKGKSPGDFVSAGSYQHVLVKMQDGEEREIVRNGPVSVYARCATVAGNDTLRMYAKTDVDGAIMFTSWGDTLDGTNAGDFLDIATPEVEREWDSSANGGPLDVSSASVATGVTKIVNHYDDSRVIAPTGHTISWEGESLLLVFNYLGARCLVAGDVHLHNLS